MPWIPCLLAAWAAAGLLGAQAPPLPPATGDGLQLRIEQAEGEVCPSVAEVGADVERLSGQRIHVGPSGTTAVRIAASPGPSGLTLALSFFGDGVQEDRRLEVADCPTLQRAAALIVAVTLAPVETSAVVTEMTRAPVPVEVEPPNPDVPTLLPAGEPFAPRPSAPARTAVRVSRSGPTPTPTPMRERWRATIWTGPTLATLPRIGAVAGGALASRLGPLLVYVEGWHAFAAQRVAVGVGARAQVSAGGVGIRLPLTAGVATIELGTGVCVGALVGQGAGDRVVSRSTRSPWAALNAGAGVVWPARGRFALVVRAEATVMLVRPAIALNDGDGQRTLFRAPPVGGRLVVGPAVRFP